MVPGRSCMYILSILSHHILTAVKFLMLLLALGWRLFSQDGSKTQRSGTILPPQPKLNWIKMYHADRVAKCEFVYTEQIFQANFYPNKRKNCKVSMSELIKFDIKGYLWS